MQLVSVLIPQRKVLETAIVAYLISASSPPFVEPKVILKGKLHNNFVNVTLGIKFRRMVEY
jgi:hypothetical protein